MDETQKVKEDGVGWPGIADDLPILWRGASPDAEGGDDPMIVIACLVGMGFSGAIIGALATWAVCC